MVCILEEMVREPGVKFDKEIICRVQCRNGILCLLYANTCV